jgi:hypothetical protein
LQQTEGEFSEIRASLMESSRHSCHAGHLAEKMCSEAVHQSSVALNREYHRIATLNYGLVHSHIEKDDFRCHANDFIFS